MILTCIILAFLALIGLTLDGKTFAFSQGRTALLKALMPFLIITGHISIYNPGKMDDFSWLGTCVWGGSSSQLRTGTQAAEGKDFHATTGTANRETVHASAYPHCYILNYNGGIRRRCTCLR